MLIKYRKNIWFYAFLCLLLILFTLCITVCRGSVYGWMHEKEVHGCGEDIRFFWEEGKESREDEGQILYLYASSALKDAVKDGIMAVRLCFSLQDGWKIDSVRGICTGETLCITVGEGCMLLDGALGAGEEVASDDEYVCLLRMEVARAEGDKPVQIQWNPHEKELLYVKGRNQQVFAYGFTCIQNPRLPLETESYPPEPPSEESTAAEGEETDTQGDVNTPTETDSSQTDTPETGEEDTVTYLGCQETPVRDGQYAVRFLFYGSYCPLICVKGGGVLSASVTHPNRVDTWKDGEQSFFIPEKGNVLTVCTFRGLSADREYEFLIMTGNGKYTVTYAYGTYGILKIHS